MTVTPRMVLGMNAGQIAATIAAFGKAAQLEPTPDCHVYHSFALSAAKVLQKMIGTDEATRLVNEQVDVLAECIAIATGAEKPVWEEVLDYLKAR